MPLFTIRNLSLRCPRNVSVKFQFKIPHRSVLYNFENAYFEWKQEKAVFLHVSLNANDLLLPLFQNRAVPLQLAKKYLFDFVSCLSC